MGSQTLGLGSKMLDHAQELFNRTMFASEQTKINIEVCQK